MGSIGTRRRDSGRRRGKDDSPQEAGHDEDGMSLASCELCLTIRVTRLPAEEDAMGWSDQWFGAGDA